MGISWIEARGRNFKQTADVDIRYGKKSNQFTFVFTQGALATKLKNTERILLGIDDSLTRIYFAPVSEKLGYKVTGDRTHKPTVFVTATKFAAMISPSAISGTYNLKYDEVEKLHYISIGALPR